MPNFVEIGQTAAQVWWFFDFPRWRPPTWIYCVGNWTKDEGRLVVFMTVQNLVGIDAVVSIICKF